FREIPDRARQSSLRPGKPGGWSGQYQCHPCGNFLGESMENRKRILVVDDEKGLVKIIRLNLEQDGFDVIEAFNGSQAMEKLRTTLPDLVLLDVMMPDTDGFTVLKMIRQIGNIPVIMLTAKGEEDDKIKGLELGADDYVTKPFSPRELTSRIRAV